MNGLPELMAELVAGAPEQGSTPRNSANSRRNWPNKSSPSFEEVLDLALTTKSRLYDGDLLSARLEPILELIDLIKHSRSQQQGAGT